MQKRALTALRFLTLLTGFLIICLGAFFVSTGSLLRCRGSLFLPYFLLPLGFLILMSGIFWSTYHQATQSKNMFSDVFRQHLGPRATHIQTVDRSDFYLPSYEDSIDPEKQVCSAQEEHSNIPPPYTESCLELLEETDPYKDNPPPYEASEVPTAGAVAAPVIDRATAEVAAGGGEGASQECLRH
ncbi:transmembrane protein 252 [Ornithorhynchus anatinus]|uniref:Transmembrane protein 252 n=1 Tax=Ornithorhynchus anatinus TaxID=9258 RepID=A0A6I8PK53_ORNAN|nr:transmembrane protein 252 [Ornithorhynchus anatinus]